MNTEKLTWYVARSGGIVAWCLLALSLVLGLLLSSRILGRRASPAWILSVHRFLGGLGVIFTAVHVVAIMLDNFVDFGFTDVLVPWASEWKPGPVAWGIIAMYLSVAIELTSFAMKRLPRRLWRAVHWSSAPLFVTATVHGYQSGTDAGRAFIVAIVVSIIVLAALTTIRIVRAARKLEPAHDPRRAVAQAKARKDRAARLDLIDEPQPAPAEPAPSLFDLDAEARPEPVASAIDEPAFAAPLAPPDPEPIVEPEPLVAAPSRPNLSQAGPAGVTPTPVGDPSPATPAPEEPAFGDLAAPSPLPPPPLEPVARSAPISAPEPVAEPAVGPPPAAPAPAPFPEPVARPAPAPVPEPPIPADVEPALTTPPVPDKPPSAPPPSPDEPAFAPPELEPALVAPAVVVDRSAGHNGAAVPGAPAPRPAWDGADDPLAWLSDDPAANPQIRRREGPVPGVWKRSRRNLADYIESDT